MIHLHCSGQLQKEMDVKLPKNPDEGKYTLDWYAGFRFVMRRKVVTVICPECRFGFVLWGVQKKHLSRLGDIIVQGIRDVLRSYGFRQDFIDRYAPENTPPELYTAMDRKAAAAVRSVAQAVERNCSIYYQTMDLIPEDQHRMINFRDWNNVGSSRPHEPWIPALEMMREVEETIGAPPLEQDAFTLDFLPGSGRDAAGCALTVPADITFRKLARIMDRLFLDSQEQRESRPGNLNHSWILPERAAESAEGSPLLEAGAPLRAYLQEGDVFSCRYKSYLGEWSVILRAARLYTNQDAMLPVFSGKGEEDSFWTGVIRKI